MRKQQPQEQGAAPAKKRPLTWKWIVAYAMIGIVFAVGLVMVVRQLWLPPQTDFQLPTPQPATTPGTGTPGTDTPGAGTPGAATPALQTPGPATPGEAESTPAPVALKVPVHIYFVQQKRSCPIIVVGVEEGGVIGAPQSADEAGWYNRSVPPGDQSRSIISGHQAFGGKRGVFSVLRSMDVGEEVVIEFDDGTLRYFLVDRIEEYHKEEVPVEYRTTGRDTETQLILYTCKGDYGADLLSQSRVVAICSEQLDKRAPDDPAPLENGAAPERPLAE